MKRVRGVRIDYDPSWDPIRAMSVKTLAVLCANDGGTEAMILSTLKKAGYLPCERRWALEQVRAWKATRRAGKALPPLSARELVKRFSASVVESAP